jgi:acyl-CoA thioesterase FadM
MVSIDRFRFVDDVFAPDAGSHIHVLDYEIQTLLSQGWQHYVATIRDGIAETPAPVVKQITTQFEAECFSGDRLRRGVRAVSRTRRSYVLEEALWRIGDGTVIATSQVVMTGIDRATGHAAELPPEMAAAIEALEGCALMDARAAGTVTDERTG